MVRVKSLKYVPEYFKKLGLIGKTLNPAKLSILDTFTCTFELNIVRFIRNDTKPLNNDN